MLTVGDRAERTFLVTDEKIEQFGAATGDRNPVHFDDAYAATTRFGGRIAHGMLTGGFFSTMIGTELPGPGTIYVSQSLRFRAPVRPGDEVRVVVLVTDLDVPGTRAVLSTEAFVGDRCVLTGEATVLVPR
jgi:3-hydroxybutyryl-CoA dehydratase